MMADGSLAPLVATQAQEGQVGAGMILRAPGGKLLFLLRGPSSDHPGTWCWPGGSYEAGEDADETALRETAEETGYVHDGDMDELDEFMGFTTYIADIAAEFDPMLNDEHTDYLWATANEAPEPLHEGAEATLAYGLPVQSQPAQDEGLAFDRNTIREIDRDGRMHTAINNISKANVCPYLGREIPGWSELGLDPDKIYQLLRCPEELAKPETVKSFNNLPLLSKHVPVTAKTYDGHQPELVVGSTGTDAEFAAPYMRNSLVIWAKDGVDGVQTDTKKELSSAYYYRADMTPGTFLGTAYDGVMRDIVGNHVALVEDGRAGDDVVVCDSKEKLMTKTMLTRKAALAQGALTVFLRPLLAQDAQIDLGPALKGVGPKNWKSRKPAIAAAITKMCEGKLAADADLDAMHTFLDSLDDEDVAEPEAAAATDDEPDLLTAGEPLDGAEPAGGATDDDPCARIMALLDDKVPSDILGQIKSILQPPAAADEEENAERPTENDGGANPGTGAADEEEPEMVTTAAMDAALRKTSDATAARIRSEQKAIRAAEAAVRPYVGELVAMDSADEVYAAAFKAMGVDVKGVHVSAYPAILKMQPLPGSRVAAKTTVAMDAASAAGYASRFPDAARIQAL